jgi:hypothetical protein
VPTNVFVQILSSNNQLLVFTFNYAESCLSVDRFNCKSDRELQFLPVYLVDFFGKFSDAGLSAISSEISKGIEKETEATRE